MVTERPLSEAEIERYRPYFHQRTLDFARVIEGSVPFWLSRKMCAVVLGHRIYLRADLDRPRAYQADTVTGIELLAHELTHVEQYLAGMTVLKYLWASCKGYRKNPYEIAAYEKAAVVRKQLMPGNLSEMV